MRNADRIAVLADGRPVELGTHEELIARRRLQCTVTIVETIAWHDTAEEGAEIASFSSVTVAFSDVEGGLGAVSGSNVQFLQGNLDVDPLFAAPASGDLHLSPGSPAIDAGRPQREPHGTDGDLEPSVLDGDGDGAQRVDMGWDELDPTELTLVGVPSVGGSVQLQTTAPAGQVYALGLSLGRFDFPLPPYGSLLVDPTTLTVVGSGLVPGSDTVLVPPDPTLVGAEAFLQTFARALPRVPGAFGRRLEVTLR